MRANVLLTGATGAIGSALLPELLAQGHQVFCLLRRRNGQSPQQRLTQICADPAAVAVVGDVTQPLCGLDPSALPRIDKLIHCAADTDLTHDKTSSVIAANAQGTAQALAIATRLGHPEFHHIGTAYIAGDADSLGEEPVGEALKAGNPRNPYETSKLEAERMVRSYQGAVSIYRPSIVVGRSDDGAASKLGRIYGFSKGVWKIRDAVRAGGKGLEFYNGRDWNSQELKIPIGIRNPARITMNLIQIDWIVEVLARLTALPARGRTYNLTHPAPVRLDTLIEMTLAALDVTNVRLVERAPGEKLSPFKLALSRLVTRGIETYRPYFAHAPQFVSEAVYEDLGPGWPVPPPITSRFIAMTIHSAEQQWQREQVTEGKGRPGATVPDLHKAAHRL